MAGERRREELGSCRSVRGRLYAIRMSVGMYSAFGIPVECVAPAICSTCLLTHTHENSRNALFAEGQSDAYTYFCVTLYLNCCSMSRSTTIKSLPKEYQRCRAPKGSALFNVHEVVCVLSCRFASKTFLRLREVFYYSHVPRFDSRIFLLWFMACSSPFQHLRQILAQVSSSTECEYTSLTRLTYESR